MPGVLVVPFRHGPFWNFSYLLACEATGEAAVIDPAWDAPRIAEESAKRGLRITTVLLTHSHSDHANGVAELVSATGARLFAHEAEANELRAHFTGPFEALANETTLAVGGLRVKSLHTPGHSPGSLSFLVEGRLFAGDTLHVGGVGRPGPGRDAVESLWESARSLRALPGETVLHPGHDEGPSAASTLEHELARVEALRAESYPAFVEALERATGRSHRHEA